MSFFDSIPLTLAQDGELPLPKSPGPGETNQNPGTPGTPGTPTTGTPGTNPPAPQRQGAFDNTFLIVLFVGLLLMIVFSMRAQKKEKKKRESMLAELKKGDKVQSIGGIIGTIVAMTETRIQLKVDENTNTKMWFTRSAIQGAVGEAMEEKKDLSAEKKD